MVILTFESVKPAAIPARLAQNAADMLGAASIQVYETLAATASSKYSNKYANALISAAVLAYNDHYPLTLRPDDIWLCIMQQLARYINHHAAALRDKFVSHSDKQTLSVESSYLFAEIGRNPAVLQEFATKTAELIAPLLVNDFAEFATPQFSTTTAADTQLYNFAMMTGMQSYFNYELHFRCGLSQITLEGTRADWQLLADRIAAFAQFDIADLTRWSGVLAPIIAKFIAAFDGEHDAEFWQKICQENAGGSHTPTVSGWIVAFDPFDTNCKWRLSDRGNFAYGAFTSFSSLVGDFPILINNNGDIHNCTMYSGVCGISERNGALCVSSGYILTEDCKQIKPATPPRSRYVAPKDPDDTDDLFERMMANNRTTF